MALNDTLSIDIARRGTIHIPAKQADHGYDIICTILRNGENIVDASTDTATFRVGKPDNTIYYGDATVNSDNTVTIHVDDDGQMLAVPGFVVVDVTLNDGNGAVKSTQNFVLDVQAAPGGEAIPSWSVFVELEELVAEAREAIPAVPAAVEAANAAAENANAAAQHSVRFDTAQSLTNNQKAQARENIGGASDEDVNGLKSASVKSSQQGAIRSNNYQDYFTDADDIPDNSIFVISSDITSQMIANLPEYGKVGNIMTYSHKVPSNYGQIQLAVYWSDKTYIRHKVYASSASGTWTSWVEFATATDISNLRISPLYGKTIGNLGDSFTAAVGLSNYGDLISAKTGCTCINYGVGSSRIYQDSETSGGIVKAFWNRVIDMQADLDIVTIFGGINDCLRTSIYTTNLGTINDVALNQEQITQGSIPTTFYQACKTTVELLLAKYPTALLMFIFPPHVLDASFNPTMAAYQGIEIIINAEKEVAKYYAIPYVDLYSNCTELNNWSANVMAYRQGSGRNIHPNQAGQNAMAHYILNGLENLAKNRFS